MAAMGPSDSTSDIDAIFREKDVVSEKEAIQFIQSTFDSNPSLLNLKKGSEYFVNGRRITLAHSVIKDDLGNIYMITKNLGTGSYGNVKLGKNLNTNELVAIKVQHPSEGTAQAISEFKKQLKQEEYFIALFGRLKGTLKRRGSPQKGRKVTDLEADKKILKFYSVQTFLTGKEFTKFLMKHPLLGGTHAHPSPVSSDKSSVKEKVSVPKDSSSKAI